VKISDHKSAAVKTAIVNAISPASAIQKIKSWLNSCLAPLVNKKAAWAASKAAIIPQLDWLIWKYKPMRDPLEKNQLCQSRLIPGSSGMNMTTSHSIRLAVAITIHTNDRRAPRFFITKATAVVRRRIRKIAAISMRPTIQSLRSA